MIYFPASQDHTIQSTPPDFSDSGEPQLRTMPFGEVLTQLKAALGQGQSWLNDFGNDDVTMPSDLYDVIQAFARLQTARQVPVPQE